MAWARCRRLKTGKYWYLITDQRKEHPAGKGKEGRELAEEWAVALNKAKRAEKAGFPTEEPRLSVWTLDDLRKIDLLEAKRRGLRTARPQFQGKASKRESHWKKLLAFFGAETNLDAITGERVREFVGSREREGVGPAAINRDLFGVLRPALRIAAEREESGYSRDPFSGIHKLDERGAARKPIALAEKDAAKLVSICSGLRRPFGAYIELLLLTASRLNERPEISERLLRYPAYKRGIPRTFHLRGRLAEVARRPRTFSRQLWKKAVEELGRPELRPHDLRHTALTIEGKRPGASLESLQKLGGWTSPAVADRYLHPDRRAMEAVRFGGRRAERRRHTSARRSPRKLLILKW